MSTPRFYKAELTEIQGDVLEVAYGRAQAQRMEKAGVTLEDRLPNNCECPECHKNEWWLLPKLGAAVREGGKPYIECVNCGYQTHL